MVSGTCKRTEVERGIWVLGCRHTHIYTHTNSCIRIRILVRICLYVYVYAYVRAYVYVYAYVYGYGHIVYSVVAKSSFGKHWCLLARIVSLRFLYLSLILAQLQYESSLARRRRGGTILAELIDWSRGFTRSLGAGNVGLGPQLFQDLLQRFECQMCSMTCIASTVGLSNYRRPARQRLPT